MTAILKTCDGSGSFVNTTFVPPKDLEISLDGKSWNYLGKTFPVGCRWPGPLRPGPGKILGVFDTNNEDHVRALVAATVDFTEQLARS